MFHTPCRVWDESSRTAGAAEGISGRVKFLPLAWAGMPKTSFRKNSDSPHVIFPLFLLLQSGIFVSRLAVYAFHKPFIFARVEKNLGM
jgi:hypothetical protein